RGSSPPSQGARRSASRYAGSRWPETTAGCAWRNGPLRGPGWRIRRRDRDADRSARAVALPGRIRRRTARAPGGRGDWPPTLQQHSVSSPWRPLAERLLSLPRAGSENAEAVHGDVQPEEAFDQAGEQVDAAPGKLLLVELD